MQEEAVPSSLLDSKTSLLDDELLDKIERAMHKQTALFQHYDVIKIALEHDPIDLAKAATRLPNSARLVIFRNLPDIEAKAAFIVNTTAPTRAMIFRAISDEEIRKLVSVLPANDAVFALEDVSLRKLRKILDSLDPKKARLIAALLQHRPHSAGRLMTNEFFSFPLNTTVGQVVEHIRENPGIELTFWIFVLSDDLELLGFVPERTLLVNAPTTAIRTLMHPVLHRVGPEALRDEIVELFERYRLPALCVVDNDERLIGVVTHDDALEMMEDLADKTIASIGGTAENLGEDETTVSRFCSRAPWLMVTVLAGLVTAMGFAFFQEEKWFLALPGFVPLITGMSGNVGIQCSTVLIRSMAIGEISAGTVRHAIIREFRIGGMIGVSFGIMCGLVAYCCNVMGVLPVPIDPGMVGITISAGVFGACCTATLLGSLSPIIFARLRIDPAIASGPIVTACNDVVATYMYFLVAWFISLAF